MDYTEQIRELLGGILPGEEEYSGKGMPQVYIDKLHDHLQPSVNKEYSPEIKKPCIHNIVMRTQMGCTINLKRLCALHPNSEYRPGRFAALFERFAYPKATALIFSNGKMVLVGTNSIEAGRMMIHIVRLMIHLSGFPTQLHKIKVANIVCTGYVDHQIDLIRLQNEFYTQAVFRAGLFAGLVYTVDMHDIVNDICIEELDKRKMRILFFDGGSFVVMGMRENKEVHRVFETIKPILEYCRSHELPQKKCSKYIDRINKSVASNAQQHADTPVPKITGVRRGASSPSKRRNHQKPKANVVNDCSPVLKETEVDSMIGLSSILRDVVGGDADNGDHLRDLATDMLTEADVVKEMSDLVTKDHHSTETYSKKRQKTKLFDMPVFL